jgi:hypothetical protein
MTERKVGRPRSCTCEECFKCKRAAYMRQWWANLTPEQKREKIAQRDPERVRRDYAKRQRKRGENLGEDRRLKQTARKRVYMAIERGELVRPDQCEDCGGPGREYRDGRAGIHAHHDNYEKALEVRWLCGDCHDAVHGFGAAEKAA